LEEVPKEDGKLKIEGSAMVAYASSKEEVLETLKKDIYAHSGVWDFSKVSIRRIEEAKPRLTLNRFRYILSSVLFGCQSMMLSSSGSDDAKYHQTQRTCHWDCFWSTKLFALPIFHQK